MNLITDRTKADVLLGTAKGRYGFEDLNRVEKAAEELSGMLGVQMHTVFKTNWGTPGVFDSKTWPTLQQMERYLGNVRKLCESVLLDATLPEFMEKLNWKSANQIEEALLTVERYARGMLERYSGDVYAGEECGL